jgi:hypothetical protein
MNYRLPAFREHSKERCRDCAEKQRAGGIGNAIKCKILAREVRHSHRCDLWHKPGSLF